MSEEPFLFQDENGCNWPDYRAYFLETYASGIGMYDSEIENDVIAVFKAHSPRNTADVWFEKIAFNLNLDPKYVAIIKEVFCTSDLLEYGASPRGAWLTEKGEAVLKTLMEHEVSK